MRYVFFLVPFLLIGCKAASDSSKTPKVALSSSKTPSAKFTRQGKPAISFAIHRIEEKPIEGAVASRSNDKPPEEVWLNPQVEVSNDDIEHTEVTKLEDGEVWWKVELYLTAEGKDKVVKLLKRMQGGRIALVYSGETHVTRVSTAPPPADQVFIPLRHFSSEQEAIKLAKGLVQPAE